jgi:hypothetical protein
MADEKKCNRCKRTKHTEEFWKEASNGIKLSGWCKLCHKEYNQTPERKAIHEKRNNSKERKEYNKKYRNNPENKARRNKRDVEKRKANVLLALAGNLRSRTSIALRHTRFNKNSKFKEYIGCSLEDLKKHLEIQFTEGMSWKNYGHGDGNWTIDHYIPLCSAKTSEELFKLCHFSNLRPMWYIPNLQKGRKIL